MDNLRFFFDIFATSVEVTGQRFDLWQRKLIAVAHGSTPIVNFGHVVGVDDGLVSFSVIALVVDDCGEQSGQDGVVVVVCIVVCVVVVVGRLLLLLLLLGSGRSR